MRRIYSSFAPLFLTVAIAASVVSGGCAGRVRVYDSNHSDYHRWNGNEDRAYRGYLNDNHMQYQDYKKLNGDQQKDYWNYRHDHPDQR